MKKKKDEKGELVSLNSELSEFDLEQLEERLETDPLGVGGLLDLASTQDLSHSVGMLGECEYCDSCSIISNNN